MTIFEPVALGEFIGSLAVIFTLSVDGGEGTWRTKTLLVYG